MLERRKRPPARSPLRSNRGVPKRASGVPGQASARRVPQRASCLHS